MSCKYFRYPLFFLLLGLLFSPSIYAKKEHKLLNHLPGYVLNGDTPIAYADVRLYQAGAKPDVRLYQAGAKHRATGGKLLGKATTDEHGYFDISYKSLSKANNKSAKKSKNNSKNKSKPKSKSKSAAVLYLIAEGNSKGSGKSPIKLAAVLDSSKEIPDEIVINARTTVATAYAMAQYTNGRSIGGKNPGLKNASGTAQNLVDTSSGEVAKLLSDFPNGELTSTIRVFNSLANMIAACIEDTGLCAGFFRAAKPPRGPEPDDTFAAMAAITQNQGRNFQELFVASQLSSLYQPALRPDLTPTTAQLNGVKPNSWVLALRYMGDGPLGQKMSGPGNTAFDADGNAWINNNFEFSLDQNPVPPLCGSTKVFKLTPTGGSAPGAPYGGVDGSGENAGGLYGAGFGIGVAPDNSAWVSGFGFKGPECAEDPEKLAVSVSQFSADGTRLSTPDGDPTTNTAGGYGYDGAGNILQPQGIKSDLEGTIWVANCAAQPVSGSSEMVSIVTRFPQGDPDKVEFYAFPDQEFSKPFDVAIDHQRHVWVTGNGTSNVLELDQNGVQVGDYIMGDNIKRPMGIATDSGGNLWIADAGLPNPPCPAVLSEDDTIGSDGSINTAAAVTLIRHKGEQRTVTTFGKTVDTPRDGLRWPWGIFIDGFDNVFVANFAGKRVMMLCGVKEQNCPPGVHTGDPISPDEGFTSDALKRVTGIQGDTSGNVWAVNNYKEDGLLPIGLNNPGGNSVVVFIGLAAPVKTPLLGPVQQP